MKLNKENPKLGDVKIKTKFLITPLTLEEETRWLETVTIKYEYKCQNPEDQRHSAPDWAWKSMSASPNVWEDSGYEYQWVPIQWVNE